MRKNTEKAIAAFMDGRAARPAVAIWTDGFTIYSYNTPIVSKFIGDDGIARYAFNETKYSVTTSQQQSAIRSSIPAVNLVSVSLGSFDRSETSLIETAKFVLRNIA